MIKTVFMALLCVHLLGDFYFQTQKMADRKRESFASTIFHCLIYGVCAWVLFILFLTELKWRYIFVFVLAHCLIDSIKYGICRFFSGTISLERFINDRNIFLIDQTAHLASIIGCSLWIQTAENIVLYQGRLAEIFDIFGISENVCLEWMVVLLLIHKPFNILITNIISGYKPMGKDERNLDRMEQRDRKAGRMIGTLERMIMAVFIAIGQYSAVGLVLTAKSIARYDRISKDQAFAEYYLLGTLLSTICATIAALLFL